MSQEVKKRINGSWVDVVTPIHIGDSPSLISKTVTTNGTYNASSDNADGYSRVVVNIPEYDGGFTVL